MEIDNTLPFSEQAAVEGRCGMSLTVSLTRVLALSPICAVNQSHNLRCSKRFSTSALHPSIQRFTHELANQQPCYTMPASSVSILTEPRQFYKELLVSYF